MWINSFQISSEEDKIYFALEASSIMEHFSSRRQNTASSLSCKVLTSNFSQDVDWPRVKDRTSWASLTSKIALQREDARNEASLRKNLVFYRVKISAPVIGASFFVFFNRHGPKLAAIRFVSFRCVVAFSRNRKLGDCSKKVPTDLSDLKIEKKPILSVALFLCLIKTNLRAKGAKLADVSLKKKMRKAKTTGIPITPKRPLYSSAVNPAVSCDFFGINGPPKLRGWHGEAIWNEIERKANRRKGWWRDERGKRLCGTHSRLFSLRKENSS